MGFWSRLFGRRDGQVDSQPAVVAVENAELEAVIACEPDGVEPYLVYGDWLQGHGDPRGELIALQARQAATRASWESVHWERDPAPQTIEPLRRAPPDDAVDELLERHRAHLYGPLLLDNDAREFCVTPDLVEWHCGFWRALRFAPNDDKRGDAPRFAEAIAHPSARFLRTLHLGSIGGMDVSLDAILAAAALPPTLRTLYVGDFIFPDESEMSWTIVGDLSPLYAQVPRLTSLVVQGAEIGLGERVELPSLRTIELLTGALPNETLEAIARSSLPELETLSVMTGSAIYGASVTVEGLAALLGGAATFPRLRALGIRNSELTDELVSLLVASPLLAQLRRLDLSLGTLTDAGARVIAENAERFAHLETLDVSRSLLEEEGRAAVASLRCRVVVADQEPDRRDEEGERYCAIGE